MINYLKKTSVNEQANEQREEIKLEPEHPIYIKNCIRSKTNAKFQETTLLQAVDTKKKIAFTLKANTILKVFVDLSKSQNCNHSRLLMLTASQN